MYSTQKIARFAETVDISDRGLAYGDGLFETIASVNGQLDNWRLHWQRLLLGAERLAINLPDENEFLEQIYLKNTLDSPCSTTLNANKIIKVIVTRGQGGRGYLKPQHQISTIIISVHDWPEHQVNDYYSGIHATICQTCLAAQPSLSGIKHLNRLEQVLGRNEFSDSHFQEGVMLDCAHSHIIEGTSSNLFFVTNNHLYTPQINTCGVKGTMRQAVFDLAKQLDMKVAESQYSVNDLLQASEIFFTNSIFGILPVSSVSINDEIKWLYCKQDDKQESHPQLRQTIASTLAAVLNKAIKRPETLYCKFD